MRYEKASENHENSYRYKKMAIFNIKNTTIDSELHIANEFNNYFVSIGPKFASN